MTDRVLNTIITSSYNCTALCTFLIFKTEPKCNTVYILSKVFHLYGCPAHADTENALVNQESPPPPPAPQKDRLGGYVKRKLLKFI